MSRRISFYHKKRGARDTGSQQLGRLGEALFYTVICLLGAVPLTLIIMTMIVPQWRANYVFRQTNCRVLEVMSPEERRGQDNRPEDSVSYRPRIRVAYKVDGRDYEAITFDRLRTWYADKARVESMTRPFQPNRTYPCWYDPEDPEQVVLVREVVWWVWSLALLAAAFLVVGLVGLGRTLILSRTSRERRAALAQRAPGIEVFEPENRLAPKFPTVPGDAELRNSPGTTLTYRLPIATTPGWQLFAAAMTCLFWNVLVAVLVGIVVRGHMSGRPDWFLTTLCLPFVAAGGWLFYYFLRQFLETTGIGAARIEISDHPLIPGQEYELLLSQAGKLTVKVLEVLLVCDEEATYRQGTDTVSDAQRVCQQMILHNEDLQIQPGLPYETRCCFRVPSGAMHTFQSGYNAIRWKLVVRGSVARWPDFVRDFPVIVYPAPSMMLGDGSPPQEPQESGTPVKGESTP